MGSKPILFAVFVSSIILMCIPALAGASAVTFKTDAQARADVASAIVAHTSCRLNFSENFLNNVSAQIPLLSSNISAETSGIDSLRTQLDAYQGTSNVTQVRSFVVLKVNPELFQDSVSLRKQLLAFRLSLNVSQKLNLSGSVKAILSDYSKRRSNYQNCSLSEVISFADAKVAYYNTSINDGINSSSSLQSYGINTSALVAIYTNATAQIVLPLQSAINSASTETEVRTAIDSYCLYNGCAAGVNYHLDAKVGIEKLKLIIAKADSTTNATVNATELAEAQTNLNNASTELASVGTSSYTSASASILWNNLTRASLEVRAALKGSAS